MAAAGSWVKGRVEFRLKRLRGTEGSWYYAAQLTGSAALGMLLNLHGRQEYSELWGLERAGWAKVVPLGAE